MSYELFGLPAELSLSTAAHLCAMSPASFRQCFIKTGRVPLSQPELGTRRIVRREDLEAAIGRSFSRADCVRLDARLARDRWLRRQRRRWKRTGEDAYTIIP